LRFYLIINQWVDDEKLAEPKSMVFGSLAAGRAAAPPCGNLRRNMLQIAWGKRRMTRGLNRNAFTRFVW
jgi:hypothetical protein